MGRPRQHDVDDLLDHARRLWIDHGLDGVTIRALSAASGVPNGAIYHAVGSRDALLARVWSREAEGFLAFQRDAVATAASTSGPVDALVAAACAPADYAIAHPDAAALLVSVRPDDLLTDRLADPDRDRLRAQKRELGRLVTDLAERVFGRHDKPALALVTLCLVDLPSATLLSRGRTTDPIARHALETSVRALATTPIPE